MAEGTRSKLKGYLFDDYVVELYKRSVGWYVGGDIVCAHDAMQLKFFFEQMQRFEELVVLDIGASTGPFSLLAKHHPGATVYAFEPHLASSQVLAANIGLNDLGDRVYPRRYALMAEEGKGVLKVPGHRVGLATLGTPNRFEKWVEVEVVTKTIDGLGLNHVDLIKIDTEGAELFVLRGGEQLIQQCKPGIMLETTNTSQFGYDGVELWALLKKLGYTRFKKVQRAADAGHTDLWAEAR